MLLPDEEEARPAASMGAELFRVCVELLDPEALLLLDGAAATLMKQAYARECHELDDAHKQALMPGLVVPLLGRRVLALDGFEASLLDPHRKQVVWAYLKQLAPLRSPY